MKAFAMQIWEMSSGEFAFWLMAFVGVLGVLWFLATELQLSRMKRMARNGIR